jgi:hypothetical protein
LLRILWLFRVLEEEEPPPPVPGTARERVFGIELPDIGECSRHDIVNLEA